MSTNTRNFPTLTKCIVNMPLFEDLSLRYLLYFSDTARAITCEEWGIVWQESGEKDNKLVLQLLTLEPVALTSLWRAKQLPTQRTLVWFPATCFVSTISFSVFGSPKHGKTLLYVIRRKRITDRIVRLFARSRSKAMKESLSFCC